MKIIDALQGSAPAFSFEFFPPKDAEGVERLFQTISELRSYEPTYVSVTYGAMGSTRGLTVELVRRIKQEVGIEAMAHLTCVGAKRAEIAEVISELEAGGIQNVLPLRGDPPKGHGILGLLISDPRPIRIPNLADHELSYGFPPNHPEMTSFLGAPVPDVPFPRVNSRDEITESMERQGGPPPDPQTSEKRAREYIDRLKAKAFGSAG